MLVMKILLMAILDHRNMDLAHAGLNEEDLSDQHADVAACLFDRDERMKPLRSSMQGCLYALLDLLDPQAGKLPCPMLPCSCGLPQGLMQYRCLRRFLWQDLCLRSACKVVA